MKPVYGLIRLYCTPKSTPAAPPMAPPIRKVSEMIRLTLMPMRLAAAWSSATARMALPILVRLTSACRPQSISSAATITTSDLTETSMVVGQLEAVVQRVHGRVDEVEGVAPERLEEADRVLEEEGDADGRDERDQAGRVAQRPVGDALDQHGQRGRSPTMPATRMSEQHEDPRRARRAAPRALRPSRISTPTKAPDDEDLASGRS